jgi:hypothetical protein
MFTYAKGDGTDPKSIVNTAKRKSKEDGVKYDKVFCVFDCFASTMIAGCHLPR